MPVRFVDVKIDRPLELPDVSARYDAVRLLVWADGVPVGYATIDNAEHALETTSVIRSITWMLAAPIWAALVEQRWLPAAPGGDGSLATSSISVVVCTRDRPSELDGCLAALAGQSYPAYEVIVVDNAPRGRSAREVAERWGMRYAFEPRPGLDWARNRGIAEARHSIVAFTDDDARPHPGWLQAVAAGFDSPGVHAVTGPVVAAELETRAQLVYEDAYGGMMNGFQPLLHSRRGRAMTYWASVYGAGCNMAFRREVLERLGGFDPALDVGTATGGGGDLDILQRVIEADGVIAYRPAALVRHFHRRTMRQLRRQLFDNGKAYSAVLWAALRRARGADRLRVVYTYLRWSYSWHARRIARRLLRREALPLHLILAELGGWVLGPLVYSLAKRRARRLERRDAGSR